MRGRTTTECMPAASLGVALYFLLHCRNLDLFVLVILCGLLRWQAIELPAVYDFISRQRPVAAASEHGQVLTNRSICAGLTGPLKKRPWAVSKPALRTNPSISRLSTPPAHTTRSKVCAGLELACTMSM